MNNRDIYKDEFGQYHEVENEDEDVELIDGHEDDGVDDFDEEYDDLFGSSDDEDPNEDEVELDDDEAYANEQHREYDVDED
jgi:hypothetical protein